MNATHHQPTREYSLETALYMARLAEWVYLRDGERMEGPGRSEWETRVTTQLQGVGFQWVQFFDEFQAVLAGHRDDYQVLIVRGSQSVKNWLTNGKAGKVEWYRGEVHRGFAAMASDLQRLLYTFAAVDSPIFITGHSLGGAIGQIYAASMVRDGLSNRIEGVYTFGQPRVGDSEFADYYHRHLCRLTHRHVHCADIVPRLPGLMPGWVKGLLLGGSLWFPPLALGLLWPGGYRHAGQLQYCDRHGEWHQDSTFAQRSTDRACAAFGHLGKAGLAMIEHHNQSKHYVAALERAVHGEVAA